jgi:hypothetical protein
MVIYLRLLLRMKDLPSKRLTRTSFVDMVVPEHGVRISYLHGGSEDGEKKSDVDVDNEEGEGENELNHLTDFTLQSPEVFDSLCEKLPTQCKSYKRL